MRRSRIVLLLAIVAAFAAVGTASAVSLTWSLENDFRTGGDSENPNRDAHGNSGTWAFQESSSLTPDETTGLLPRNPATYTNLATWDATYGSEGLEAWGGSEPTGDDFLPNVAKNPSGSAVTADPTSLGGFPWPGDAVALHPSSTRLAVVKWTSPAAGQVSINAVFTDLDDRAGDGADWSIDTTGTNIADGAFEQGGGDSHQTSSPVPVAAGQSIYFTVGPGAASNPNSDSTRLELDIIHEPVGASPNPAVRPTSVDFGVVPIGQASTKQVKLENTGDGTLNVSGVTLNGPFSAPGGTGACVGNLAPAASCEIQLRFAANDKSFKAGSLVFTHNAGGGPIAVPLSGSGFDPSEDPFPPASQAGPSDAKRASAAASSTVTGAQFVKSGIVQPVFSTLPNTSFVNQTNGLIGQAGTNLIGQAGTNLIGQAGTNLISDAGGGLIGQAGTNLIGQAGTNLIGQAGTNFRPRASSVRSSNVKAKCPKSFLRKIKSRKARKKAKCKRVVLATGITSLARPGRGTLTVKPTRAGKKILKRAMAFAKAQRKKKRGKRKKVTPLTMSYATVVQPGGPGTAAYYAVKKLKIKP